VSASDGAAGGTALGDIVWIGDVMRLGSAALALGLVLSAAAAVILSGHVDQRIRFGLFGAFGVVLVGGHLAQLGRAWTWRLPMIAVIVALALISTVIYVRREWRELLSGDGPPRWPAAGWRTRDETSRRGQQQPGRHTAGEQGGQVGAQDDDR
jgi:hypothetical protein